MKDCSTFSSVAAVYDRRIVGPASGALALQWPVPFA